MVTDDQASAEMSWPWESKAAVDERFYAQNPTVFTVAISDNWRGPGFDVTNFGSGAAMMQVQTAHVGNGNLRSLVLLDAASHDALLAVEEFRSGDGKRRWEAFRGRGTSGKDRLFVAVDKRRLCRFGSTVHVFLDKVLIDDLPPDFVVNGSYSRGRGMMTVSRSTKGGYDDGGFIAQIRKESTYTVWVKPGLDQVFVLALTVILDQMYNLN
jgi:hypothetical protein